MIFIFTAQTAGGKTSIVPEIAKSLNLENNIGFTTRPMRTGEVHGVHNFFVTVEELDTMGDDIICRKEYQTAHGLWIYGMSLSSFADSKNYVMILDPAGAREMKERFGERAHIIHIEVPYELRKQRAYAREEKTYDEEIERRFKADLEAFDGFIDEADFVAHNIDKETALREITHYIAYHLNGHDKIRS